MGAEPDRCQPVSAGRRGVGKTGENLLSWCDAYGWNHSLAPRAPFRYAQKRFARGARRSGSWLFALSLRRNRVASKFYYQTRRCFTAPRFLFLTLLLMRGDVVRASALPIHDRHGRARPGHPASAAPKPNPILSSRDANLCHNWPLASHAGGRTRKALGA
jgi:hypothetical protein